MGPDTAAHIGDEYAYFIAVFDIADVDNGFAAFLANGGQLFKSALTVPDIINFSPPTNVKPPHELRQIGICVAQERREI
jgi:hypothetical protein